MINIFILISTYIYVAITTIPIVNAIIPALISFGIFSGSLLLCFFNRNVLNKSLFILFFLICYVFCYSNLDKALILRFYQGITLIYPFVILIYFIEINQIKKIENILFIYLIFVGITSITTFKYLIDHPGVSRLLATGKFSETENISVLMSNCGGYGFINSLIILFPLIIGLYKTKKINLVFFSIIAYFIFMVILKSEYTTALLFFIFELAFLLYNPAKIKFNKFLLIFIISCLLVFFVFRPLLVYILEYVISINESISVNERLNDLLNLLNSSYIDEDSDLSKRNDRYNVSIYFIKEYFLTGNLIYGIHAASGHSTFLDILALTGILGIINYIGMYLIINKYVYSILIQLKGKEYYILTCIIYILFSIINNSLFSSMFIILFLIGPLFVIYYNNQKIVDK